MLGVLQRPGRLVGDRRHLAVHVEQLALVEAEAFHDVLEGVGVHRLLERLPQQILPAFGVGEVAVDRQHDVVGDQDFGRGEEAEIALDGAALVVGQAVARLPQRDVGLHRDFGRHPVVVAAGEILLPGPFVLQRQQLVDVGAAVDHRLVVDRHAAACAVDRAEAGGIGGGWRCLGTATAARWRGRRGWFGPVEHDRCLLRSVCLLAGFAVGIVDRAGLTRIGRSVPCRRHDDRRMRQRRRDETALSLPSVPFSVDFSTCVARARAQVVGGLQPALPGQPIQLRRASCPMGLAM